MSASPSAPRRKRSDRHPAVAVSAGCHDPAVGNAPADVAQDAILPPGSDQLRLRSDTANCDYTALAASSRSAQGLPPTITDFRILERVAGILSGPRQTVDEPSVMDSHPACSRVLSHLAPKGEGVQQLCKLPASHYADWVD